MEDPQLTKPIDVSQAPEARATVFFDGECLLCNGFVDFIIRIDQANILRIAPLQGSTAENLLPPLPDNTEDWSIYYIEAGKLYDQSDAVLRILRRLGGIWYWLGFFLIIPRSIRDFVYRIIARNRYRWFGRTASCRMPTEQERGRFLP